MSYWREREYNDGEVEDLCAAAGHKYYGDDSGVGRCYCGAKTYPASDGERHDDA
jgi:hypothetical protein